MDMNKLEPGNCIYLSSDGWKIFRTSFVEEKTECTITRNGNFIAITCDESVAFRLINVLRKEE